MFVQRASLCLALWVSTATYGRCQFPEDPAVLFPETTVVWAEFDSLGDLLSHPIRNQIQSTATFKELWKSPEVVKLRGGITLAELALGDRLESVATKLTQGGVVLAIDAKTEGLVLISRTESSEWLSEYLGRLLKLARDDAKNKSQDDPVKQANYRGVDAYEFNDIIIAAIEDRLLLTNKSDLGKTIIDRWKDSKSDSNLASKKSFADERQSRKAEGSYASSTHEIGWLWVDVQALRDKGIAKELFAGKAKDFGAELILGGLLSTLNKTPSITGNLSLEGSTVKLRMQSPHDPSWVGEERAYFVGSADRGNALPLLMPEGAVASLSTYRDVSQMWLRAGDLFNQEVNDQLAQADNTLTTLFSGRDFGEEILGAMEPEMRLVASRQEYAEGAPVPAIKLPGFALVATLKDPNKMRPELKRIFQSFIGFLNIVGAMEGQAQFDMNMESENGMQFISATYVPEVDRKSSDEAPIQFNFSPCLAFSGEIAVLSSSIPLAKQLAAEVAKAPKDGQGSNPQETKPGTKTNTLVDLDVQALKQILLDNRRQLVSQNVLEKGHSRKDAEKEIDTLLSILELFDRSSLSLSFANNVQLEMTATLAK